MPLRYVPADGHGRRGHPRALTGVVGYQFDRTSPWGPMMKTPPAMFAGILLAIFAFFLLAVYVWNMVYPNAQPGVGG